MIKQIKFTKADWFPLSKETQRRFKTKTVTPGKFDREKKPYELFCLFKKGFSIDFKSGVNVIVGENGTGKTSLLGCFSNYSGKAPNNTDLSWGDYIDEEDYHKRFRENKEFLYEIDGDLSYRNAVFFNAEDDNPVTAIPKMLNPNSKDFMNLSVGYMFAQEESHGESMIPILDYLLDNAHNAIIFMDEPETALSIRNQVRIALKMKKSAEENNNQIIVSTHSLPIVELFETCFDMESRRWYDADDYINESRRPFTHKEI